VVAVCSLRIKAIRSTKTSVYSSSTWRHIPEDGILHSYQREDLKFYNPHAVHHMPLRDMKAGIWCAIRAWTIMGPCSFHETTNSEHYAREVVSPIFGQQNDDDKSYRHIMQDNEIAHTPKNFC
jgi:hypothetical protein